VCTFDFSQAAWKHPLYEELYKIILIFEGFLLYVISTFASLEYATSKMLGVGLYFVRITHLRFDEKHAEPDLTNPWQGRTKTPASVLTVHAALKGRGAHHLYLETSSVSKQARSINTSSW
jgi:hypothetical protein